MQRREVIKLGIVAVGCLGCGGSGSSSDDAPMDAPPGGTGFEMCGENICLDLMHAANAMLLNVNGARAINIPAKIIVVRETATEFVVLSRICTHQGCVLAYQGVTMELSCGCHGSKFDIGGSVLRGPATRSLKKYATTFDETLQTLTILLV